MDDFEEQWLLRPEEVATALAISRSQVYALMAEGVLPSIKIGRSRRIPVDALRSWLAKEIEAQRWPPP